MMQMPLNRVENHISPGGSIDRLFGEMAVAELIPSTGMLHVFWAIYERA